MLITLAIWIYVWFVLTSLGLMFHFLSKKTILNKNSVEINNPLLLVFNGYCVCMFLCSTANFITGINLSIHTIISLIAFLTLFVFREDWKELIKYIKSSAITFSTWQWSLFVLALISIALASISPPTNIDSGNYHVQAIQWINKYKTVPGLGNLLGNYAYNQSSFFVEAFFNFSFFTASPFRVINGFLALVLVLDIIASLDLKKIKTGIGHIIGVVIITFFLITYRRWISSPTPDIVVALMVYYIFWLAIRRVTNEKTYKTNSVLISIYFVAISAVTVKLSALILPLIAIVVIISTSNFFKTKKIIFYISIATVVLIPWMLRSVILSGYLIFPVSEIDLFTFDWKVPNAVVDGIKNAIHGFSTTPSKSTEEIMNYSLWDRIIIWADRTSLHRISLLLIILVSQVIYLVLLFSKKKLSLSERNIILLGTVTFVSIVFWFVTAPDFRFGSAFVYMSLTISFIFFIPKIIIHSRLLLLCLGGLTAIFLLRKVHINNIIKYPVITASYDVPKVSIASGIGFSYAIPKEGSLCWNYSIPCIPFGNMRYIESRGKTIEDGFRFVYPKVSRRNKYLNTSINVVLLTPEIEFNR